MNKRTNMASLAAVLAVVLGLPGMTQAELVWHTTQGDFENAMTTQGNVLDGIETFEENTYPDRMMAMLSDPLQSGVPSGSFMTGLEAMNLTVQTNTLRGDPVTPSPRGTDALIIVTEGLIGNVSDVILTNAYADGLDLIFGDLNKTGVGFDTIAYMHDSVEVRVYDTNNVFLGMSTSSADMAGSNFIGVSADVPIGRINIYDGYQSFGTQGGDNIQMWSVPEPTTLSLLLLGGLSVLRRRR